MSITFFLQSNILQGITYVIPFYYIVLPFFTRHYMGLLGVILLSLDPWPPPLGEGYKKMTAIDKYCQISTTYWRMSYTDHFWKEHLDFLKNVQRKNISGIWGYQNMQILRLWSKYCIHKYYIIIIVFWFVGFLWVSLGLLGVTLASLGPRRPPQVRGWSDCITGDNPGPTGVHGVHVDQGPQGRPPQENRQGNIIAL